MTSAFTAPKRSEGRGPYLQEWLKGNAENVTTSGGREVPTGKCLDVDSFAFRLYTHCLRVIQRFCRRCLDQDADSPLSNTDLQSLKEEVEKLFLWGESFGNGKLGKALNLSEDLRDNVVEILGDVGKLVVISTSPILILWYAIERDIC